MDGRGRPVGIVTGSDLLRVFLRPDEDIRADIVDEMITRRFSVDQSAIDVTVQDGSVTFTGVLERRSLVKQLVDATHRVAGVIAVHNQLHYRADDTLLPASPLVGWNSSFTSAWTRTQSPGSGTYQKARGCSAP